MKIVVIGNSGSGKSWLSRHLATRFGTQVIHLDELFWEPGGFDRKRDHAVVSSLIAASKSSESWIVEGVFGELAEQYLNEAETLIWLDIEWSLCKSRLQQRGSESKEHMDRSQSEAGLVKLLEWASLYSTRGDSRSFDGHQKLFNEFQGIRVRLNDEKEVNAFVADTQSFHRADCLTAAAHVKRFPLTPPAPT